MNIKMSFFRQAEEFIKKYTPGCVRVVLIDYDQPDSISGGACAVKIGGEEHAQSARKQFSSISCAHLNEAVAPDAKFIFVYKMEWDQTSDLAKKFILLHELAHHELATFRVEDGVCVTDASQFGNSDVLMEAACDLWAVARLGDNGLPAMAQWVNDIEIRYGHVPDLLKERYQIIKKVAGE